MRLHSAEGLIHPCMHNTVGIVTACTKSYALRLMDMGYGYLGLCTGSKHLILSTASLFCYVTMS